MSTDQQQALTRIGWKLVDMHLESVDAVKQVTANLRSAMNHYATLPKGHDK
ncbi:hypothetical protein ACT3UQ_08825 [Glutamicibacter sp. AOP12-B1-11]|uniref:hypothetical protein n=1 Tax=Glutamicibacter sp. AOP12-B1-11 TaxID=3457725 RepID=UPI004033E7D2